MRRAVSGAERKRSWWLETFSSAEQLMADFVKTHGRKAKDVMTGQVISVSPDTSLQEIANLLEKHGIKRVPVIENGRLVGIVSRANLVQQRPVGWLSSTSRKRMKPCGKSYC
jgi:predicted transcriptional regulator